MTATRIYVVIEKEEHDADVFLVRCSSPAQARNHVNKDKHDVRVATQEDLEKYLSAGVKVETASSE